MPDLPLPDRELVAQVCDRLGLAGAAITPLHGGSRNRSYRLSGGRRDVVLRVDGEHDEAYAVARQHEHAAQRLAAGHGLAPHLLLTGTGYAVTEFVPSPPWSREWAASAEGAMRAGEWLARLHALPPSAAPRQVRFLDSLEAYLRQLREAGPGPGLLEKARRVVQGLGPFTPALCHNDLHHLNLIDSAAGLLAIDWEYAGTGDPRMDLAGYVAYHDLDPPAVAALLAGYGAPRDPACSGEVERARWLFEAVWWAWLELRRSLDGSELAEQAAARRRLVLRLQGGQES